MATPLRVEAGMRGEGQHTKHGGLPAGAVLPPVVTMPAAARARRRISPISGRALEILGHAVEYLADEFVLASGALPSIHIHDPQVEAMQLLMQANRAVYFACPLVPSMRIRMKHWIVKQVSRPKFRATRA